MLFRIPMFLGFPTTTDSYEFSKYIGDLCKAYKTDVRRMGEEFDDKFPGLRQSAVEALKEVSACDSKKTNLEHRQGKMRATVDGKTSAWH